MSVQMSLTGVVPSVAGREYQFAKAVSHALCHVGKQAYILKAEQERAIVSTTAL